jgi:transcriptional regulator with XRE-family HTH domain
VWLINDKEVGTLNIKIIREENNLTQQELAEILGVSQSTVAMWETNNSLPRADKLPAIAKALGCTIDELLKAE